MTGPTLLRDARLPADDRLVDVAIGGGRVTDVGPGLDVGDSEDVVALGGRTVLPGLWDHHVHAAQWAASRRRVDVHGAASAVEAAARVRQAASAPSFDRDVLIGHGMHHLRWPDTPDPSLLDRAAPGVAVLLQGVDLHTAWASTTALQRVGLGDRASGLLHEGDCFHAVASLVEVSAAEQDAWVVDAMTRAAARGVTGIRDFEFGDPVRDWQRRLASRRVDVRVVANVYPQALGDAIDRGWPTGRAVPDTDGLLHVGHLKLFVDGALNSRTAWCHHPYPGGATDDRGTLASPPEKLLALASRAVEAGIAPAIHAIGDRAVGLALDVLDQAGCPGRIEHAQLVADDDVDRLARHDRIVGVQPAHLLDDRDTAEVQWAGRTDRAFPFGSLLDAGARLEFGSDAPVSPLDPWRGIAAAVTRTDGERAPWHPEQALDVRDALRASCGGRIDVAVAAPADLVVLDDDPLRCTPSTLRDPSVWATMLAGRWTHRP